MRRVLRKLLPEDHQSLETRSCKRRNNNERPSYQNVRVSFSSAAFFFDSLLQLRAAHYRSGWGVDFICHLLLRKWRNEVPSTKSDPIAGNERANFLSHPLLTRCRKCRLGEEGTGYYALV
jgi:hypothetical protein